MKKDQVLRKCNFIKVFIQLGDIGQLRVESVGSHFGGGVGQISISEKISMRCKCKSTTHQVINLQIKYSSYIIQLFKVSHECTMRVGVVSCPSYLAHFLVHLHFDVNPLQCDYRYKTIEANGNTSSQNTSVFPSAYIGNSFSPYR